MKRQRGESELALRAQADHAELRRLVRAIGSRENARKLGELLERHIRFEQRVLLPRAEEILSDSEVTAVLAER